MNQPSPSGMSRIHVSRSALVRASICLWLIGAIGCASHDSVTPSAISPAGVMQQPIDPLVDVPDDFELEIKVLVGNKVPDQDVLERREVHMVLFPDGTLHAAAGKGVIPGARPGLARTLLRDQVADAWALMGRLDLRDGGESPTRAVRPPGQAEIVHVVELTANGERRRRVKRFVGPCKDSATTTLVRSIGGLAWLSDAPEAGNDIIPMRYDFGPDQWARYRKTSE
jgi:hypothetical protein